MAAGGLRRGLKPPLAYIVLDALGYVFVGGCDAKQGRPCLVPDARLRVPASRCRPRSIPGSNRFRAMNWLVALLCHCHHLRP